MREIERTERSAGEVLSAAQAAVDKCGWDAPWGADADHLKSIEQVADFIGSGYTFYTIDPSDHVVSEADRWSAGELEESWRRMRHTLGWLDRYRGFSAKLGGGIELSISDIDLQRCAVKYGAAIVYTLRLAAEIGRQADAAGVPYEIEMSVDETDRPTTLAEHYIIASEILSAGIPLVSLAPRYIGGFEKGIDYIGDPLDFERNVARHAAVAQALGPYKLSLHSGSDKLSIYGGFARATQGMFHVKTAGTSYLEALRVVAEVDSALFERVIGSARGHFDADRATYHMTITLADAPAPGQVSAGELAAAYLDHDDGRQIAHVTFGSVLCDPLLGPEIKSLLESESHPYEQFLMRHFVAHLTALNP